MPISWLRREIQKKKLRKFGHMSKLGVPYLPCSLVWTKMNLDKYSSVYPTYLPKKFGHFGPKVCYWILNFDRNLITFFLTSPLSQPKKATDFIREALKSRLSLGMTSNKTYHFQTTANHHRFIKVWTSIADLPTSKFVVQTFFLEKVWLRNTLPTYDLDICPNFRSFFFWISLQTTYI